MFSRLTIFYFFMPRPRRNPQNTYEKKSAKHFLEKIREHGADVLGRAVLTAAYCQPVHFM
jgi:hypothetical protein